MTPRPIIVFTLSVFIVPLAVACSSSRPNAGGPATEAGAQEIRDDADEIPCEPRRVLQTVCQHCHSLPPIRGAPFPLVRRSDILARRSGGVVRELMVQQLDAQRMPLSPVTIEPAEREVLLGWLRAGAPATTPQECSETPEGGAGSGPDGAPVNRATTERPDASSDADASSGADTDGAPSDAGDQ